MNKAVLSYSLYSVREDRLVNKQCNTTMGAEIKTHREQVNPKGKQCLIFLGESWEKLMKGYMTYISKDE